MFPVFAQVFPVGIYYGNGIMINATGTLLKQGSNQNNLKPGSEVLKSEVVGPGTASAR